MKKIIVANWKMYLKENESVDLAKKYSARFSDNNNIELILAPAYLYLSAVGKLAQRSGFSLAAQDLSAGDAGAATGEISGKMLKQIGCGYSLVGHSERRAGCGETDEIVNQKINQCYDSGLIPILCIGETMEQNINGERESVLARQIESALAKATGLPENKLLIAYEPVWAIGTGRAMESGEMVKVQMIVKRMVVSLYGERFYDNNVCLLYGGSVNEINAQSFLRQPSIHGLLVASASLDVESLSNIIKEVE